MKEEPLFTINPIQQVLKRPGRLYHVAHISIFWKKAMHQKPQYKL
jgi:hypothetical protein